MSKKKKEKQKKTPKQKFKIFLKVLMWIAIVLAVIAMIIAITNVISIKSSENFVASIKPVEYTSQLEPTIDEKDGYYTFTSDEDFKVLHLTDVHIGAGFLSSRKDSMAINAVEAMVREEKPDLVIVSGDIAYPVPFQSGTFNNKNGAIIFADLMEKLGVYWCLAFGNHDTEAYSFYTREDLSKIYSDKDRYPHCLYQRGPEDVDGCGNYMVKLQKTDGAISQAFVMLDSHSYTDNDYFGALWRYDCVHENQVKWYEQQVGVLTEENNGVTPKSIMFFHIPPIEMQTAYNEYVDNGEKDTDNVKMMYGSAGEHKLVVYSSQHNYGLFDKVKELDSTKAIFVGHDHLNSFSLLVDGIQLGYGHSIDYLAYAGISKYGTQRGCNVITVSPDGSYTAKLENYYQDKYQTLKGKEKVTMDSYYADEEAAE